MSPYEAATAYLARGWSVIPLRRREKRPAGPWETYQSEYPLADEVDAWFAAGQANIGIVTGRLSGLVVLDLDGPEAVEYARSHGVPSTPTVRTAHGYHLYLAYPAGHDVGNSVHLSGVPGLDLRAEGGYVVAPPSVHPSGHVYRWLAGRSPADVPLAPSPAWLTTLLTAPTSPPSLPLSPYVPYTEPGWVQSLLAGVTEGARNQSCARLAGHYFRSGRSEGEVLGLLLAWAALCTPPLPAREVEATVRSVARRDSRWTAYPRLPGPVHVPLGWAGNAVITADWPSARKHAAQGYAVVVLIRDRLPAGWTSIVQRAGSIYIDGLNEAQKTSVSTQVQKLKGGKAS